MEAMFRCSVQQKVTSSSRKPCKLKYSHPLIQESSFFHFKFLFSYFSLDIKVVFSIA